MYRIYKILTLSVLSIFFTSCVTGKNTAIEGINSKDSDLGQKTFELPSDAGSIWFPVTWTFELGNKPQTSTTFKFRNLNFSVKRKGSLANSHSLLFAPAVKGETVLDVQNSRVSFALPRVFSLPEGDYFISAFSAEIISVADNKSFKIELSSSQIFDASSGSVSTFSVKNGQLAALPRVNINTVVGDTDNEKSIPKSAVTVVDSAAIPGDLILESLGLGFDSIPIIKAASQSFPLLRFSIPTGEQARKLFVQKRDLLKFGIIFDVPCTIQGQYKFVWKRSNDEKEYYSIINFGEDKETKCVETKSVPLLMSFPYGTWTLLASQFKIAIKTNKENNFGIAVEGEHDIKRKISFEIDQNTKIIGENNTYSLSNFPEAKNSVFYLGRFILTKTKESSAENFSVTTTWDRRFRLEELKNMFSASDFYNAYSVTKLVRDQVKDQVQSMLKVVSENPEKLQKNHAELRQKSAEMFAQCIVDREQIDPLISVNGKLTFSGLKGRSYVDLTSIDIQSDELSKTWIKECIDKKFRSFRFKEKLPGNTSGQLEFILQ